MSGSGRHRFGGISLSVALGMLEAVGEKCRKRGRPDIYFGFLLANNDVHVRFRHDPLGTMNLSARSRRFRAYGFFCKTSQSQRRSYGRHGQ